MSAARFCCNPKRVLAVERARAVVEDLLENDRVAYAVNTGVGKLADLRISPDDIRKLQVRPFALARGRRRKTAGRRRYARHGTAACQLSR